MGECVHGCQWVAVTLRNSLFNPLVLQHTTSIVLKIILDYKKLDPPPPYKIIGRLKYLAHAWYGCNVILEGGEVCV